jgi:hypothetical protein
MSDRIERLGRANELLAVIASCGRKFFANTSPETESVGGARLTQFELAPSGHVYLIDRYKGRRIYTHYQGRWRGFSEGGTLKALCEELRDFIRSGKPIYHLSFGPWPEWVCNGDLWGYGTDIQQVRDAANRLGIIAPHPTEKPAVPQPDTPL